MSKEVKRLRALWLKASEQYRVEEPDGTFKTEEIDGRQEPMVDVSRMSVALTVFAIKNGLNNNRPVSINNIKYWRKIGRVSDHIAALIEAFNEANPPQPDTN